MNKYISIILLLTLLLLPLVIYEEIQNFLLSKIKNNKLKALVTAGPTNEYIDPVRFITNKSSGKQGYEIAKSLYKRGFDTTLISGPTNLKIDENIKLIKVETAEEMFKATQKNLPTDIAVFAAAVADFTPSEFSNQKIKKGEHDEFQLRMSRTRDVLASLGESKTEKQILVGFALETHDELNHAQKKLDKKNDFKRFAFYSGKEIKTRDIIINNYIYKCQVVYYN